MHIDKHLATELSAKILGTQTHNKISLGLEIIEHPCRLEHLGKPVIFIEPEPFLDEFGLLVANIVTRSPLPIEPANEEIGRYHPVAWYRERCEWVIAQRLAYGARGRLESIAYEFIGGNVAFWNLST